jgi:hypothetical protein
MTSKNVASLCAQGQWVRLWLTKIGQRTPRRALWVFCLLLLLSLTLWLNASITDYSAAGGFLMPVNMSSPFLLAASFALRPPSFCGNGDVFAQREGPGKVERFFSQRKPLGHTITSFLVQPRLSVCSTAAPHQDDYSTAVGKTTEKGKSAPPVDLLVVVPCSPQDVASRETIRNSWGSVVRRTWPFSQRHWRVELVFLLGASTHDFNYKDLLSEGQELGDLLVVDMHDSYRNLTLKMVAGFHWLASHCDMRRVKHVLKADTDTFVHMDLLLHVLERLANTQPHVAQNSILGDIVCATSFSGYLCLGQDPITYPFTTYPPYAAGPTYIIPGRHLPAIANASRFLPLLSAEDAFITGLVAQALTLPRLHLQGILGMHAVRQLCPASPCLMLGNHPKTATKLTDTDLSLEMMVEIWRAVLAGPQYCQAHTTLWNHACKGLNAFADRYWPV